MASVPRIVTVDPSDQIGAIIRGAMMMLNRRFILVEVPTAQDALLELRNSEVSILVSTYRLPDSNGLELAGRAIRESAATSVIILANPDDPEVDPNTLQNASYAYLIRPVGESFVRALRVGLGETVASEQAGSGTNSALDLGPIPEIDLRMLHDQVMMMMRESSAMGAYVADRTGRIIYSEGATGYFDINACAAILAPQFANTVQMRDWTTGNAWSLQYYDGEDYDLVCMSLGLHYFVVLILDGSKAPRFGPIMKYGREGADHVAEAIGAEAWAFRRQVTTRLTQTISIPQPSLLDHLEAEEEPLAQVASTFDLQPSEPIIVPEVELKLEPLSDLDADKLFGQQVDESAFDDLFGADEGGVSFLSGDNSVSFDQAMNMGILDQ